MSCWRDKGGLDPILETITLGRYDLMKMAKLKNSFAPVRWLAITLGAVVLTVGVGLRAQSITVPNGSFESQVAGPPFFVDTRIDSWQKAPKPGYFDEQAFGLTWDQTAGAFLDSNPYVNRDGNQAVYMLSFSQVALFQDYNTVDWNDVVPTHAFNALYEPGKSYQLTVGVFGKQMTEGATLNLSLYYRDSGNSMAPVGSTTVVFAATNFPITAPLNLLQYQVTVPEVQLENPWANQYIGIKLESTFGAGNGYWDVDHVRLVAVPEPSSLSLLGAGLGSAWLMMRRRTQPQT